MIAGERTEARSPGYRHVETLLGAERCVILDGGVETEVQRLSGRNPDQELWGTGALYQAPETVLDVHRGHLAAGCNVLSTATWSILSAPEAEQRARLSQGDPSHWIDIARLGIQLARKATSEAGARAGVRRRVRDLRGGQLARPAPDDRAARARCSPTTRRTCSCSRRGR